MSRFPMIPPHRALAALLLPAVIAGCSAEQCGDPRYDSMGTALGCTVGPGYRQQTDALAAEARQKQSVAAGLRRENAQLQGELAALDSQQRGLATRVMASNTQIAALDTQLSQQLGQGRISQTEHDLLQAQLASAAASSRAVDPQDSAAAQRVADLEREVADLSAMLE